MKRVLLIGFYGCGNLGDDAILYALLSQAEGKNHHITVSLGKEPLHGFTLPHGVKAVYRKGIFLLTAIFCSHYVVFGGGSLLQNRTGQASLCYYLALILLSKMLRKQVYFVSSGIGPIRKRGWRWICGKILALCNGVTMRDYRAIAFAESLGVKEVEYAPDPVYFLSPKALPASFFLPKRYILVIPRKRTGISVSLFAEEILRQTKRHKAQPLIADFFPKEDCEYTALLISHLSALGLTPMLVPPLSPCEMLSVVQNAEKVFTMRYHGAVFADRVSVPFHVYGDDPKLLAVEEERGEDVRGAFFKKLP
jgi:polysaccharide pyruvyl transferase CsaB